MPKQEVSLSINGEQRMVVIRFADTLLEVLRGKLGLTGAKPGCNNGDCGACTVLIDTCPYKACIMLAVETVGHEITTVEGLHSTPIQQAFADCYAFQCGYCTPGFIMNAHALLQQHRVIDEYTIREWLESNICRCTSYEEIGEAVRTAARLRDARTAPSLDTSVDTQQRRDL
ncbi:(2Fe-2S)-binding protein [Alicyclobacillus acidiphilus]|uniref:(2Fe-2S)-binding protein n=1 Tax=Alicyclobacillus acidiphilus TaxID=182455 RepID=UPI000836BEFA|nr:(2Fe-2S)-binding protein [Alicyclobacillus acidiphilus]